MGKFIPLHIGHDTLKQYAKRLEGKLEKAEDTIRRRNWQIKRFTELH